jgi:hypothetical protein
VCVNVDKIFTFCKKKESGRDVCVGVCVCMYVSR